MAQEAIKYGDVFEMSGELADMPISPRDAAAMQSAENRAFGKTLKGGPAEIMHSAASKNLEAGLVGANDDSGVFPGYQTDEERAADLTIGDALEAAAAVIGDKPVEWTDAAAIAAAEMRATGANVVTPNGVGAAAEAAVTVNQVMRLDEDKTTVAQVIGDAKGMLSHDKPVKRQDAELVTAAELREDTAGGVVIREPQRNPATLHGGVADTVAMAARLNEP